MEIAQRRHDYRMCQGKILARGADRFNAHFSIVSLGRLRGVHFADTMPEKNTEDHIELINICTWMHVDQEPIV